MGAFAEAQTCRRLVLLNYFGEGRQEPCGNCDICLDPPKQYDGLNDAQIALSTIGRVNQRFGMGYVVEVIRGANNQRIRDFGHDKLKVYGMGREKSHEHWVSVIRQLIHLGLVMQNIAQLRITVDGCRASGTPWRRSAKACGAAHRRPQTPRDAEIVRR